MKYTCSSILLPMCPKKIFHVFSKLLEDFEQTILFLTFKWFHNGKTHKAKWNIFQGSRNVKESRKHVGQYLNKFYIWNILSSGRLHYQILYLHQKIFIVFCNCLYLDVKPREQHISHEIRLLSPLKVER